ncbi:MULTISPECIES: Rieske 2Fe-2S domain-containing protein [unclassified Streptomyces]|uniref:Rieske 2Fe-2S domain-containing protein n=1 Tax=unclassified Streptomyces TaxID=2593676 RepID=UPI000DAE3A17|nr:MULTISPECIES: Rieske 2Fe-2S domain-containing protein [unclassified Streptomyces]PZT72279.1 hypothetical protein DNK55_27350 [Streptomyces sp. AC1-42T]PZT81398.1 hypothetical protein DNK56_04215 [Streptomyces sp. AC1-42W]
MTDTIRTRTPAGDATLVVRLAGGAVRIPARCPHRGAPLAEAAVTGTLLVCPWHGATFDLRTGSRLRGPVCPDLPVTADETRAQESGASNTPPEDESSADTPGEPV